MIVVTRSQPICTCLRDHSCSIETQLPIDRSIGATMLVGVLRWCVVHRAVGQPLTCSAPIAGLQRLQGIHSAPM